MSSGIVGVGAMNIAPPGVANTEIALGTKLNGCGEPGQETVTTIGTAPVALKYAKFIPFKRAPRGTVIVPATPEAVAAMLVVSPILVKEATSNRL
jgi:hypothetical protein